MKFRATFLALALCAAFIGEKAPLVLSQGRDELYAGFRHPKYARSFAAETFYGEKKVISFREEGKDSKNGEENFPLAVLHVWASWCRPCLEELPELFEFSAKHPEVPIIVVSWGDRPGAAKKFIRSLESRYAGSKTGILPFLKREDFDSADARYYNLVSWPTTFFVYRGEIKGIAVGTLSWRGAEAEKRLKNFKEGRMVFQKENQ